MASLVLGNWTVVRFRALLLIVLTILCLPAGAQPTDTILLVTDSNNAEMTSLKDATVVQLSKLLTALPTAQWQKINLVTYDYAMQPDRDYCVTALNIKPEDLPFLGLVEWKEKVAIRVLFSVRVTDPAQAAREVMSHTTTVIQGPSLGEGVVQEGHQTIGSTGGSLQLSDGTSVTLPAEAVPNGSFFVLQKLDPKAYFGGKGNRVLIRVGSNVNTMAAEASIRVPLPANLPPGTVVVAGEFDGSSQAVSVCPVKVVEDGGRRFAVVKTNHFSDWFVEWFSTPPAQVAALEVPYYNQGESSYCWAACLHMLTQAARYAPDLAMFDFIGQMSVDTDGIADLTFRWSSVLQSMVRKRTNVSATRMIWDYFNAGKCEDYVKRQLAAGHPVALHITSIDHAVVVVGYHEHEFLVHDPQSTTKAIGYTHRSWEEQTRVKTMGRADKIVTCVIPAERLDPARPRVTVNIVSRALEFKTRRKETLAFLYDHRNQEGYSFANPQTREPVREIPEQVVTLNSNVGIEVINCSQTAPATVGVWLEIHSRGPQGKHYSDHKVLTLGPNSKAVFQPAAVKVEVFREPGDRAYQYDLSVSVRRGSQEEDRESIHFFMAPARPVPVPSYPMFPAGAYTLRTSSFQAGGRQISMDEWNVDIDQAGAVTLAYGRPSSNVTLTGSGTVLPNPNPATRGGPGSFRNFIWNVKFVYTSRGQAGGECTVSGSFDGMKLSGTVNSGQSSVAFSNVLGILVGRSP